MQAWRDADESEHFDHRAIRARLDRLRELSAAGDVKGLLFTLNEGIHGNIDGMGNERLYQKARFGTKRLIEDYVAEVVAALDRIAASRAIPREEKRDFFRRAQHRSEEHTSELQSLMRISYSVFCLTKQQKHQVTNV